MRSEVEDLSDQRLAEWLLDADSSARADAWARLVKAFGRHEASRRRLGWRSAWSLARRVREASLSSAETALDFVEEFGAIDTSPFSGVGVREQRRAEVLLVVYFVVDE